MPPAWSVRTAGDVPDRDAGRDQSQALFNRWKQHGDLRARDQILERYLPLARRLAWRYQSSSIEPFEDLVQVACLGLLLAMDRFDPYRGVPFASFAVPTVLGELRRHFRDTGWSAHVPRPAQELALEVGNARLDISSRAGRSPTVTDLAQYLEITAENVVIGLQAAAARYGVSLDAPLDDRGQGAAPLGESIGHEDERYGLVETTASLRVAMSRLTVTERHALGLRIVDGLKQEEIGQRLGCSQMQASRLLRAAADKLRTSLEG